MGGIFIGGMHPVLPQSMTTRLPTQLEECHSQAMAIARAGGELVRITTPTPAEGEALAPFMRALRGSGCDVPIVADIHFNPKAALAAAEYADKIRINPGNFLGRSFLTPQFDYDAIKLALGEALAPLLSRCAARGVAIRLGVNHGSLAPHIAARYGEGAEGMVQSALEFIEACRAQDFHQLVISLKASSPLLMVHANRLLVAEMRARQWDYPLHLGVTEAGNALEGRVRSAIGIGALLGDGIGDTIRVSLTEAPEKEIPAAKALINAINEWAENELEKSPSTIPYDPYHQNGQCAGLLFRRIYSNECGKPNQLFTALGFREENQQGWQATPSAFDGLLLSEDCDHSLIPDSLYSHFFYPSGKGHWQSLDKKRKVELYSPSEVLQWSSADLANDTILLLESERKGVGDSRLAVLHLRALGVTNPILLAYSPALSWSTDWETYALSLSAAFGTLLVDRLGAGIVMPARSANPPDERELGLAILQAVGVRANRADVFACPGCGRTLFDLEATLERVKAAAGHLRGLRIGVMGCIVNGPGEMAGADYGYVGAGPDSVTLYKGQEIMRRGIPAKNAVEALVELIRENGDWEEA